MLKVTQQGTGRETTLVCLRFRHVVRNLVHNKRWNEWKNLIFKGTFSERRKSVYKGLGAMNEQE